MSLLTAGLSFVVDAALGVWLGAMTFFSFVAAPRTFAVLPDDQAGRVVDDVFPRYYAVGVALGTVAIVAALAAASVSGIGADTGLVVLFAAVAVAPTAYARWVLIPRMEAADGSAFERYHRRSVALNGVAMLGALLALAASHLP